MKITVITLGVAALLLTSVFSKSTGEERVEKSAKILTDLYITLRNIIAPKSPLSEGITSNRFVLLSPGKVLNYWDYYPGQDYEESLLRQNSSAPEVLVPPAAMEKWFDIADVTVGADPFSGGVTGKSMSRAYETIISQMNVLGIKTKSLDAQAKYKMARRYLTATVQDPDNVTVNTTRLSLYDRYLKIYSKYRLEMEDKIEEARKTRSAIDYQLWFQRNYPSLLSRVEGAYTKWLTFGDKNLVELYKTYLDSASAGSELRDAQIALRASGVQSLDRTRTVYPVSFEPGNWYKYLLPRIKGPSRDMLLARKGMLESERDALKTMIDFNNHNRDRAEQTQNQLQGKLNSSTARRDEKTNQSISAMTECMNQSARQQAPNGSTRRPSSKCSKFKQANAEAVTATFQQAQVKFEYESAAFLLNSKGQLNIFLRTRLGSLNKEIKKIEKKLSLSRPYLGEVVDSREFQDLNSVLNETEQNLDDAWTSFQYDSESSRTQTDTETNSWNVAVGLGVGGKVFGVQVSAHYGESTTDMRQSFNSANLKVSGQLLRVTIKRPWFKPSIFENPSLSFMQRDEAQQKNTYVSPGPSTEKDLRDNIRGSRSNLYLLPEYVTSFVLARDVKLQFSEVNANSVSRAMQMIAGGSLSVNYGIFNAKASFGTKKTKQSVTADRTANGIIINIPGAQIIGYFTNVLPRFPRSHK